MLIIPTLLRLAVPATTTTIAPGLPGVKLAFRAGCLTDFGINPAGICHEQFDARLLYKSREPRRGSISTRTQGPDQGRGDTAETQADVTRRRFEAEAGTDPKEACKAGPRTATHQFVVP